MGIETFPEIESFQKLPRQVIVKGGSSSFSEELGAELRGIVINNIGNTIRDLRVHLVIFDKQGIPILNVSIVPPSQMLPQGEIASFAFKVPEHREEISDYYLYASWKFDDRE